jgi:hypothetical protein
MRKHVLATSLCAFAFAAGAAALSGGSNDPYLQREDDEVDLTTLDINPDSVIDMADVAAILADWGDRGSIADVNGDGIVDGGDLGLVLASFGANVAWPLTEADDGGVLPPIDCDGCSNNSEA